MESVGDRVLTVPNALSALRLVGVPIFCWLVLTRRDGAALLVLVVSGVSDYLDGYLARRWNQVTRVGQLLDPLADRLYIVTTVLALGWREIVPWWLVAALLLRDVLLSLTIPVLARHGYGPLPVHFLGKTATFALLYAFPLLLLAHGDSLAAAVARPIAWAFLWWGVGLYWWAAWLYLRQTLDLARGS
jgi:cardiolipin synthase (CMP-forming)